MKIPITIMVKGEEELERVKTLTDEHFCYAYTENTDRDERPFAEYYENYEHVRGGRRMKIVLGQQYDELIDLHQKLRAASIPIPIEYQIALALTAIAVEIDRISHNLYTIGEGR